MLCLNSYFTWMAANGLISTAIMCKSALCIYACDCIDAQNVALGLLFPGSVRAAAWQKNVSGHSQGHRPFSSAIIVIFSFSTALLISLRNHTDRKWNNQCPSLLAAVFPFLFGLFLFYNWLLLVSTQPFVIHCYRQLVVANCVPKRVGVHHNIIAYGPRV